jgi:hypothetical protein
VLLQIIHVMAKAHGMAKKAENEGISVLLVYGVTWIGCLFWLHLSLVDVF